MKAEPPKYEYATDIAGRRPQLKYHKTLGHAKNALMAKYNRIARKHDRVMYRVTENNLLEQVYRIPANSNPAVMPWENEREEVLKKLRAEQSLYLRRLTGLTEETAKCKSDIERVSREIQALEESNG